MVRDKYHSLVGLIIYYKIVVLDNQFVKQETYTKSASWASSWSIGHAFA